jgi:hypothetical protein
MFRASLQLNGFILKRTKCVLVAWTLLCAVPVEAQVANLPPYTNFWHRFVSSDEAFSMSLFFAEGGEVNGYYYYHNSEVKHPIRGRFDNKMLSLYQEKNGKSSSFLYGKITNEDNAIFSGFRVDSALNKKSFRFHCATICGGSYDHQYEIGAPFGKDDEVEDFARMVIHKIQAGDRNWVVNHLSYPFSTLMGTKRVEIKSKQECLSVYDKMVTKEFLDFIEGTLVVDLLVNGQGVEINGTGIWISNTSESTEEKYAFCIVTIL